MTEYPAPLADIMDAESVRAELAEVEARAEAALWWRENGGAVETIVRDERRAA